MHEVSLFSDLYSYSAAFDIQAAADAPTLQKLLYSRKDVSYVLSCSVRSVDYLIANKQLAIRKLGKKVMVSHSELVRFSKGDHKFLTQSPEEAA